MSEKKNPVRKLTMEEIEMINGGSGDKKAIILFCSSCKKNMLFYVLSDKMAICSECKKVAQY